MRLSLAPIPFFWPRQRVMDFYAQAAQWPVDTVYLGETVCPKRREVRLPDWLAIAEQLQAQGKQVVLSSLALIAADSDLKTVRAVCRNGRYAVEANDIGAVHLLAELGVPFVCGPSINIYNAGTLKILRDLGMQRWVMPVELSGQTLHAILQDMQALTSPPETEVLVHGYLPLAYSARCFTARHHNLPKDDCDLVCLRYPQGLAVNSQDGQRVFTLNGIQTQSGAPCNLIGALPALRRWGVDLLRIVPSAEGTAEAVAQFHQALQGNANPLHLHDLDCNGYWYGEPGMVHRPHAEDP